MIVWLSNSKSYSTTTLNDAIVLQLYRNNMSTCVIEIVYKKGRTTAKLDISEILLYVCGHYCRDHQIHRDHLNYFMRTTRCELICC